MGIPEGEEAEKGPESIFKTLMTENFSNMGREMDVHIHETQKVPVRLNLNRATPRNITIKLSKVEDKDRRKVQQERREKLPTRESPM